MANTIRDIKAQLIGGKLGVINVHGSPYMHILRENTTE